MLALLSVWVALLTLVLSSAMLVYRPAFTDLTVTLVLYFGSPGALCLAGLVLWAYRKESTEDAGVRAQRMQAKVAIVLAIVSAAVVYGLIIGSQKLELFEAAARVSYNAARGTPENGSKDVAS